MTKKLNVGIIGCGYWGPNLARNFNQLPGAELKILCDGQQDRLDHMKTQYPHAEMTSDHNEVINRKDIDVVAIATPIRTHYALAKQSLLAGKHTFVEKPLAASVAESEELCAIAEERGLTLMVGHTFVYTQDVRFIRTMVESGELGDVLSINSSRLNLGLFQKDINVVWDLAPHDISILLYIMKSKPTGVNCTGKAHVSEGLEDVATLTMEFENGSFATIQSSWLHPNKIRKMTIVGNKRMVVYDDIKMNEKVKIYDKRVEAPPHYDTFGEFQYSYHYGDIRTPYIRQAEPLRLECQHFLDCVNNGTTPDSSGVDGLNVVRVLEAASQSLASKGGHVEIKIPENVNI